jgi:hypothetical protein
LVDQEGLWFKVLGAKYGVEDERVKGEGRMCRMCVNCDVKEGVELSVEQWFENNVSNGEQKSF